MAKLDNKDKGFWEGLGDWDVIVCQRHGVMRGAGEEQGKGYQRGTYGGCSGQ